MNREHEFMDNIEPARFRYKDLNVPGTSEGPNMGVMAQDMQKSDAGRELVEKGEDGVLRFSRNKAINLSLASLAYLHKRVKALEGRKK